jgi:hypothetical protein
MSDQELDAIIGRTVREHQSETQKLAALESKAITYSTDLRTLAHQLSVKANAKNSPPPPYDYDTVRKLLGNFPTVADIQGLIDELEITKRKVDELAKARREMGIAG